MASDPNGDSAAMESLPSCSIAMATYNGAPYLREQLQSIRTQTVLPGELVICDDASADVSVGIVESFARDAPFAVRLERAVGSQIVSDIAGDLPGIVE